MELRRDSSGTAQRPRRSLTACLVDIIDERLLHRTAAITEDYVMIPLTTIASFILV